MSQRHLRLGHTWYNNVVWAPLQLAVVIQSKLDMGSAYDLVVRLFLGEANAYLPQIAIDDRPKK